MKQYEIVIIGGGPAGMASAVAAKAQGANQILLIEREGYLGGILNQCIHNGFGLHRFKEELTGPEYAAKEIQQVEEAQIPYKINTMVIDIDENKRITYMNKEEGVVTIEAKAIILAMGCRERARGAIRLAGTRPAGIYTAGTAQRLMNIDGLKVGKEVVILGSGDIGLIMARRMTLEGAKVKLVAEIMPYSGGLKRNIVQCLEDYGIPLKLSHTVINIHGKERVTGVTIAKVDANRQPIPGTEEFYSCDTLLLSVGLIPENELTKEIGIPLNPKTQGAKVNQKMETEIDGIFACGNVLHVHDLADYVSEEAEIAGRGATEYVLHESRESRGDKIELLAGNGVRYTVPSSVEVGSLGDQVKVLFRVDKVYENCEIVVSFDHTIQSRRKRRILAPGEMEQVILKREAFTSGMTPKQIVIHIEEGEKG